LAKPVILAVDDDRVVLSAVERDLRRRYGKDYRVIGAGSGEAALDALRQLSLRSEIVALFVVDQRMPQMTGVEFLTEAIQIFPGAKRALLTAYADTEAAIRAINEIRLDHYLMKPWDPPEEHLYPVLDDLLDDWRGAYRPAFEGIRIVGHRWSPLTHEIKNFLARNQVPYQWLDIESDAAARQLLETAHADVARLPVVVLTDGTTLTQPSNLQVAEKIGLRTQATMPFYDLIVVGSGPAGLAAAVYGASEGLETLVIEREAPGGQAGQSSRIENYLGFPVGLSGADLARRAVAQATRFGAEILTPQEVLTCVRQDSYKVVTLADGASLTCHALLVATGVSYRKLDAPGVEALAGAGVFYGAAITEALATQGEDCYVVGAGNSAGQAAMYLAKFARSVSILVRGDSLTESMSQYLIEQIGQTPNIRVLTRTVVEAAHGEGRLEAVTISNQATGEKQTVPAAALFIFIGAMPRTDWLAGVVERDKAGFILTGPDLIRDGKPPSDWPLTRDPYWLEASTPGIFAAGDVRSRSVKRVASAVGEGSMAVQFIHQYLATL
jgi:thioredoxin reductase (NADPH)